MGQQWGVPVALIGLVVSDGESQRAVDAGRWELSGEVIRGAEHSGVLEVDRDGVAAQNLRSALRTAWPLVLNHDLVHTARTQDLTRVHSEIEIMENIQGIEFMVLLWKNP